ncbi:phage holin family protein [uncultured Dysgonomonas sp.]|uniref:Holin n=1 Tax=uncultured Dysgonomonas sp. TaxID=206096 RepID=A0A212IXH4_9BACT|nr:phage holin family protein [uncultured Dysgonomonas sp.]SBV91872.1 conserved membrane hypothetical protein [uncultured Dysgonomonas sp.]
MDFILTNLPKADLVLALWIFELIAVFIDLIMGLYKAKSLNYLITSDGLKRSANKIILYYSLMAFGSMMDIAAFGLEFVSVPYVSILFCIFVLAIEGKSVFERASDKERRRLMNGAKDVTAILASKDDIAKAVHEYLTRKEKDNETK